MLIDLHVHSYLSMNCGLEPGKILERAATHGLDGVAFTETNTQDGCDELFDIAKKAKLKVFVGLELNTDKGQYLVFFPDPMKAPEPVQMWGSNREKPWSAAEALPKLKSLGAAIVAARPYDRDSDFYAGDYILTEKNLAAVEGYNAKVRQNANDLAVEAAETLKLPMIGGSDTRTSLDELGRAATFFKQPVKNQAELVQSLLKSEGYWAVQMGELPRVSRPGEAREQEKKAKKKKRRRWIGGGGGKG
ncbi:MAG: PHP domain-containing protein [Myxococcaceae bacterium]